MDAPSQDLPLTELRVADFSRVVAGPYGSYLLARMGADVIRIEDFDPVDTTRQFGPFSDDERSLNRGGYFCSLNGAKRSVSLHLSDTAQANLAREIMLSCDVVIENFLFGTMERFGLGYASLAKTKPSLVMVSATGFGRTGSMRSHRAYMNTVAAFIGLTALNGYEGQRQIPVGATFSDFVAGTSVALAALLAVRRARATGRGQHVDLSMAEASMALMGQPFMDYLLTGATPTRQGNGFTKMAPCNVYPSTGGDKWVAISVSSDEQWARLREVMGNPAWADSPGFAERVGRYAYRAEIDSHIRAWTSQFDNFELTLLLQANGVPAFPSSDPEDLTLNPHFKARGVIAVQEFPLEPGRSMPNLPWHLASHKALDGSIPPPPRLGQHNRDVLTAMTSAPSSLVNHIQDAVVNVSAG